MQAFHVPIAATFPSEPIVGELDLIMHFAAEEEICKERKPQQPGDQVAVPVTLLRSPRSVSCGVERLAPPAG
jgi:hypothetical protein